MEVDALLLGEKAHIRDLLGAQEAREVHFLRRGADDLEDLAQLISLELFAALFGSAVGRHRRKRVARRSREEGLAVVVVLNVFLHHVQQFGEDAAQ